MDRKGSALIIVLVVIIALIVVGGLWYWRMGQPISQSPQISMPSSTLNNLSSALEAKQAINQQYAQDEAAGIQNPAPRSAYVVSVGLVGGLPGENSSIFLSENSLRAGVQAMNDAVVFSITNTGEDDTYALKATSKLGWGDLENVPATISIAQDKTADIEIPIQLPSSVAPGELEQIGLTAISETDLNASGTADIALGVSGDTKTYQNTTYGFSIKYPGDQADPQILSNDTSTIMYSMVADDGSTFEVDFYNNSAPFQNPVYNEDTDSYDTLMYATSTRQWLVNASSECPLGATTLQGVPYYVISTGFHAGDVFDVYITTNGLIVTVGANAFYPDEINFNNPQTVLTATCSVEE